MGLLAATKTPDTSSGKKSAVGSLSLQSSTLMRPSASTSVFALAPLFAIGRGNRLAKSVEFSFETQLNVTRVRE